MKDIKFGTDGWRAVIAREFTVENVMRISEGSAIWMKKNNKNKVVIGFDTRFGGSLFSEASARVFASYGIKVLLDRKFVTTPMVSLATKVLGADLGVVITASHNPPSYNGYKLKSGFGGPALEQDLKEVENEIPSKASIPERSFEQYLEEGRIVERDLEKVYLNAVKKRFDIEGLQNIANTMAYDSMFGAGQNFMKKIFTGAFHLHDEVNPSFKGIAPEPILRNLGDLSAVLKSKPDLKFGLANDGDADRIGLFDEYGEFVDAHHIMLLLLYYLVEYENESGKVVISKASTEKIKSLAQKYGLEYQYTKIGFKNIAPVMLKEKVIMGGEEAGGLSAIGHIPERDGIWVGLLIMELLQRSGKSLSELIQHIYGIVGSFAYDRYDLHLPEDQKLRIMEMCHRGELKEIAGKKIIKTYDLDGYKFYLDKDSWVMIRPSGTEPVLRLYVQGRDKESLKTLINTARDYLRSI